MRGILPWATQVEPTLDHHWPAQTPPVTLASLLRPQCKPWPARCVVQVYRLAAPNGSPSLDIFLRSTMVDPLRSPSVHSATSHRLLTSRAYALGGFPRRCQYTRCFDSSRKASDGQQLGVQVSLLQTIDQPPLTHSALLLVPPCPSLHYTPERSATFV